MPKNFKNHRKRNWQPRSEINNYRKRNCDNEQYEWGHNYNNYQHYNVNYPYYNDPIPSCVNIFYHDNRFNGNNNIRSRGNNFHNNINFNGNNGTPSYINNFYISNQFNENNDMPFYINSFHENIQFNKNNRTLSHRNKFYNSNKFNENNSTPSHTNNFYDSNQFTENNGVPSCVNSFHANNEFNENNGTPSHINKFYDSNQFNENNDLPSQVNSFHNNMQFNENNGKPSEINKFCDNNHFNENDDEPSCVNSFHDNMQLNVNNGTPSHTNKFNNNEKDNELMSVNDFYHNNQLNENSDGPPCVNNLSDNTEINKNEEEKLPPKSSKETRIVKKHNLYRKPELQEDDRFENHELSYAENNNAMNYWERQNKSNMYVNSAINKIQCQMAPVKATNEIEKKLNQMLSMPVEMSKGKSLLEKMGWKGGGLGKDGEGIVEPIAPTAKYATMTIGLGHRTNELPQRTAPKIPPQNVFKKRIRRKHTEDVQFNGNFQTNVLMKILEFVKNDSELEILFDNSLWRSERKRVHNIVEKLGCCDGVEELGYDKQMDIDIARDILEHNRYLLITESFGKAPNRKLRLYKDVLPYVYLILPDDLNDTKCHTDYVKNDRLLGNDDELEKKEENYELFDGGDELENKQGNDELFGDEIKQENGEVIADKLEGKQENDIGPFVKRVEIVKVENNTEVNNEEANSENINSNCDSEKNLEIKEVIEVKNSESEYVLVQESENSSKCLTKIVDFFMNFAEDIDYLEFRFLGPFKSKQVDAIKTFFDICLQRDERQSKEKTIIQEALSNKDFNFEIKQEPNGSYAIFKSEKRQPLPLH